MGIGSFPSRLPIALPDFVRPFPVLHAGGHLLLRITERASQGWKRMVGFEPDQMDRQKCACKKLVVYFLIQKFYQIKIYQFKEKLSAFQEISIS